MDEVPKKGIPSRIKMQNLQVEGSHSFHFYLSEI